MPGRVFMVTGTPVGSAAAGRSIQDGRAEQPGFQGSAAPPPFRVTFGDGTAEVEVDILPDPVVAAQDLGGPWPCWSGSTP